MLEYTPEHTPEHMSKYTPKSITMPVVTRSRSNLHRNQQSPHGSNSSMLGKFEPEEPTDTQKIIVLLRSQTDCPSVDQFIAINLSNLLLDNRLNFDKLARLDSNLNFLSHSAHNLFNLSKCHAFASVAEFCRAVAGSNGPCILHSLAQIVMYNVITYKKMFKQYTELKKKSRELLVQQKQMHKDFVQTEKDVNDIKHKLHKSQDKYQTKHTQQNELKQDIAFVNTRQQELQRANQAKDKTIQQQHDLST